jgi:hypothetical protein
MATETILLKAKNKKDGTTVLKLKNKSGSKWHDNNLTSDVGAGDHVTWELHNDSIKAINNVFSKNKTNIFSTNPSPNKDGTWSGTISHNALPGAEEPYSIQYTTADDNLHLDDPTLKVKAPN